MSKPSADLCLPQKITAVILKNSWQNRSPPFPSLHAEWSSPATPPSCPAPLWSTRSDTLPILPAYHSYSPSCSLSFPGFSYLYRTNASVISATVPHRLWLFSPQYKYAWHVLEITWIFFQFLPILYSKRDTTMHFAWIVIRTPDRKNIRKAGHPYESTLSTTAVYPGRQWFDRWPSPTDHSGRTGAVPFCTGDRLLELRQCDRSRPDRLLHLWSERYHETL